MELGEFLLQVQGEVHSEIAERLAADTKEYPYPESVFTEIVMRHMSEIGMTFDPVVCHYSVSIGNARLHLSGYAISEEADQLDLFVSLYEETDEIKAISDTETKAAAERCLRFLTRCADGRLASTMDQSNEAYGLAATIQGSYANLDQIRIYVLTDRQTKTKNFKPRDVAGRLVKLEVMDIERLFRHWAAGKPRDEVVVDFSEIAGSALPCVYVPAESGDYRYVLTVVPGECLRFVYERFGARLLEANVRSFLSVTGKVNKGIRDTLKEAPDRFMAYNNGIVIVADEAGFGRTSAGEPGLAWLKGMQIVNGGQTTASLYFAKRKDASIDLGLVRVPAKVIVLPSADAVQEERLIAAISKFANTQNVVRASDLSANHPFHIEVEKLASSTYCPDGVGRWFYERAAGSYNTMLAREGTTPAKLRNLREAVPPARRVTKTDLAKCLTAWDQAPDVVSMGAQKNFQRFMEALREQEEREGPHLPDVSEYKRMVAKAIVFKAAHKKALASCRAFQGNVTAYVVALVASRLGPTMDLGRIWQQQGVSARLGEQIGVWCTEVSAVLLRTAGARMVSEWAKKRECREAVLGAVYTPSMNGIPEVWSVESRAGA